MARRFFSGNSLEQAILQAASHFGIDPEQVAYSVREKKHGFVNVRRRAVIEVDPEMPKKVAAAKPSILVQEKPPISIEKTTSGRSRGVVVEAPQDGRVLDEAKSLERASYGSDSISSKEGHTKAKVGDADEMKGFGAKKDLGSDDLDEDDFEDDDLEDDDLEDDDLEDDDDDLDEDDLEDDDLDEDLEDGEFDEVDAAYEKAVRLLIRLIDLELDYSIEEEEGTFFVEFYGPDSNDLLEDDGEALRAIGHLLPRLVRGLAGESWPCKVDCEGFEEARIQELEELAERVAEEVRAGGKATLLETMNPADRRVIHLALAEDPAVETYSEGEGFLKRVKIVPV